MSIPYYCVFRLPLFSCVKFLDSCVVGASLMDPGEADVEEDEDRLHEQTKLKGATFQIVGTISSQTEKCSFIAEEYSVSKSQIAYRIMQKI